jgi:F-type H+-transporting ATPase subunit delta
MARTSARKYAQAAWEAADAADRPALAAAVASLASEIQSRDRLRRFLSDPGVPLARKEELLDRVLEGEPPVAASLMKVLIRDGAARQTPEVARTLGRFAQVAEGYRQVEVVTAHPLPEELLADLERRLAVAGPIRITQRVDPEILGGVRIKIGDTLIDGSLRRRIRALAETLKGAA